jgi:hypothetical protein
MRFDPYGLDWLDDTTNFASGFGDTISLGATNWVRDQMGTNGAVNFCSSAYANGGYSALAIEVAASGGSAFLKIGARKLTQAQARKNLPKHFRDLYPTGKNASIHHINPLFGHPKSTYPSFQRILGGNTTFPTAALSASIRHGKFNIAKVGNNVHANLHKITYVADILAKVFFNQAVTAGRIANSASGIDGCGCQ